MVMGMVLLLRLLLYELMLLLLSLQQLLFL